MRVLPALCMILMAGAALAQDPVAARQQAMKTIAASAKTMGDMATDKAPFEPDAAEAARAAMQDAAARIPALFGPQVLEGETEALPAIWQNPADFAAKAGALERAAAGATTGSLDEVKAAMGQIGPTCRACHSDYRE